MVKRKKRNFRRRIEELSSSEINKIHQMLAQGIRVKSIINQMNLRYKAIDELFERDENGKPKYNLNKNKNNENTN